MNLINQVSSPVDNTSFCVLNHVLVSIINMHISLLQLLSIYFATVKLVYLVIIWLLISENLQYSN